MSDQGIDRQLDALYSVRFSAAERATKSRMWKTLCSCFFQRRIPPESTVLDVGAGYCDFINNISAARRIAVDLNPDTARYASPGVEVHEISLVEMSEVLEHGTVDVAFASNVFEHLRSPDALLQTLRTIHTVLRPGGILVVLQPNVRLVGPRFWDFLDHTLPLTEKGMSEALELAGFNVIEVRARFLPYTTKSMLPQSTLLLRAYLALRPAQWMFGKQMLLVAQR